MTEQEIKRIKQQIEKENKMADEKRREYATTGSETAATLMSIYNGRAAGMQTILDILT